MTDQDQQDQPHVEQQDHQDPNDVVQSEEAVPEEETDTPPSPPPPSPRAEEEVVRKKAQKYTALQRLKYASALERRGDLFVAPFAEQLVIQSPTLTLAEDVLNEDGEYKSYVGFKVKRAHAHVFDDAETALLSEAVKNANTWFGQELEQSFIESCFKRFFDPSSRILTVRLDEGFTADVPKGTKVKIVLESDGALFTKKQFGLLLTAKVITKIENSPTQYLFDSEETLEAEHVSSGGLLDAAGIESFD